MLLSYAAAEAVAAEARSRLLFYECSIEEVRWAAAVGGSGAPHEGEDEAGGGAFRSENGAPREEISASPHSQGPDSPRGSAAAATEGVPPLDTALSAVTSDGGGYTIGHRVVAVPSLERYRLASAAGGRGGGGGSNASSSSSSSYSDDSSSDDSSSPIHGGGGDQPPVFFASLPRKLIYVQLLASCDPTPTRVCAPSSASPSAPESAVGPLRCGGPSGGSGSSSGVGGRCATLPAVPGRALTQPLISAIGDSVRLSEGVAGQGVGGIGARAVVDEVFVAFVDMGSNITFARVTEAF